jgi:hypothetical protein
MGRAQGRRGRAEFIRCREGSDLAYSPRLPRRLEVGADVTSVGGAFCPNAGSAAGAGAFARRHSRT